MTRTDRPTRRTAAVLGALLLAGAAAACAPAAAVPEPPPPVAAPAAAELTRADVDAWLDGLLPAALERTRIAGATVSVVHDGEVLTARGYGWADTGADGGDPVPVDPGTTLFRVGSVSKVVTATAVMQLVERGDLDLDEPVADHLDFPLPTRFDEPITLRHLLTHTAGFEERVGGLIGTDPAAVDLRTALAQDAPEQVYEPGTVPAYSNYGNALAGYVVERVSGQPFEQYVQEHVVEPAGMGAATFAQPVPEDSAADVARGYPTSDEPSVPFEAVGVPPAGSLSASATDMAAFMLAQLGEPAGAPLLARETLEQMHAPALGADSLGTLADGPRMTLGLFDESRNGHRIVGHGGDTNVFHSHLQLYPDDRTGVFVSLNSSGTGELDSLELREQLMAGFADRYFPGGAAGGAGVDEASTVEHADQVAGTYVQSRGMHSTFLRVLGLLSPTTVTAADGGRILLTPGPGTDRPVLYEEVEPWVWQEVGGQARIAARVTDGQVEAISWQSAFALLPAGASSGVALPVLLGSLAVLLVTVLAWPVGAVVRRARRRPRAGVVRGAARVARELTRGAALAAVVAAVAWVGVVTTVMGLTEVPGGAIRGVQVLQGLAALGVVPAVAVLVGDVRRGTGWRRVLGSALVVAALAGVAWFAVAYGLLAPSVTY